MTTVAIENDKVIIAFNERRRDLLLSCMDADRLAEALREAADGAEKNPPGLFRGEPWGCHVDSYDGYVCIRFSEYATRVPMPPQAARRLADLIQAKIPEAAHKMRIRWIHQKGA